MMWNNINELLSDNNQLNACKRQLFDSHLHKDPKDSLLEFINQVCVNHSLISFY